MSIAFARAQAERIAKQFGVAAAPVDVHRIARELGVPVVMSDLGRETSGLLVTHGDHVCIVVHGGDPRRRQRFTIAHELGHYVLRHQSAHEHVHVDRGNLISQRGPRASEGIDPKEIEANQFAASLLMPSPLLRTEIERLRLPILDRDVTALSKKFEVSEQAMTIRLSTLRLL